MAKQYVMALDAGTTSCRAILFDAEQNIVGLAQRGTTVVWDREQIKAQWTLDKLYQPEMSADKARDLYKGWKNVLRRVRSGAVL